MNKKSLAKLSDEELKELEAAQSKKLNAIRIEYAKINSELDKIWKDAERISEEISSRKVQANEAQTDPEWLLKVHDNNGMESSVRYAACEKWLASLGLGGSGYVVRQTKPLFG